MPATTKKPIKIVPNTIKTIPKVPLSPISKSKSFQEKLNDIQNNIDINIDDIPEDLLDIWDELQEDITPKLISKNYKLWLTIFTPFILPGIINGMSGKPSVPQPVVTVQEPAPDPKQIVNFAQKYFAEHGLELCKSLTKTDLNSMKQDLINNWGKGPDAFSKTFQDSYPVSKSRLENIYRSERHLAEYNGVLERAKIADHKYKQWRAVGDERSCDLCMSHDMETVPINEPFSNGEMTATGHPQCRCSMVTYSEDDYNEMKEDSAYLDDVVNTIKLNYNCPDSEKIGSGPGSCGGNKPNEKHEPEKPTNIATTKNKKIASFISNALQEDPRRMFHGYIPKKGKLLTTNDTGFWLDSEGKSYVHKKLVDIPEDKRNDLINVHSHAGQDTEQRIVNKKDVADFKGIESFSGGDFQMLQFNIKNGYGRKIAVIVAPDEYDYFEVPEKKLGEFIKIKDIANKFEAHSSSLEESRKFLMEISNKNGFIYRPAIKFEQKQDSAYLADAFETIKLNYNCPDSEKIGSGPGSCGGSKPDTKKEILEGQENKQEATLTNLPLGKPDFSGVSIQISKDVGLTNEKYRQELGDNVVGALDAYRRTDYIGINSYLRNGNTKGQDINSIKDQIKLLDSAFIKKTSEPITTFRVLRGQDIINKYQPGSKIDEKAYVSTTISGGVGFFGADSENAISLQIEVPKGTPFVDMSKATTGVENELLLPRNGKLLVKEVRDVTKKLYNLDENGNMVPKDVTRKYARVEYIPENDNNVNSSFQEISSTFNSELGGFHITEYKAPDAKPLRIMSQDKADNAKLLEAIQDLPPETLPAQFTVMKMPNNVPAKYYAKLDTIGVSKKLSSAEMTKAIKDVMTTIKRNERLNEVALLQDAYNTIKLNYRCEENPPGSGNFKCDITKQSDKQLDKTNKLRLKEIKTKIKEVEAKNQAIRDQMDKVPRDSPKWKDLQKQIDTDTPYKLETYAKILSYKHPDIPKGTPAIRIADYTGLEDELGGKIDEYLIGRDQTIVIDQVYIRPADDNRLYLEYNAHIKTNEQKQNSEYLEDVTDFIKLNYKCKAGTVDETNACKPTAEQTNELKNLRLDVNPKNKEHKKPRSTTPDRFFETNLSTNINQELSSSITSVIKNAYKNIPELNGVPLKVVNVNEKENRDLENAYAAHDMNKIYLNDKYFSDINEMQEKLTKEVESGFHPKGCNTAESIITHELGHLLFNGMALRGDEKWDNISKVIQEAKDSGELAKVSRYALSEAGNGELSEAASEIFASIFHTKEEDKEPVVKKVRDILFNKFNENSAYLADAFKTIKQNYKCPKGTVDDSNRCNIEDSDVPETRVFYEENIKSKILSLNDSKYPKDAVFRSKSRSNMTKNVELDILNNDNHVKILSDNIDRLHYQCDNLKIPRLRGIVADKNTKAGLASMADGILAVTPDMFRNDPDSEVDLRLSRNQERLNYINNKINSLESLIQSDKEKWAKNNPSLVNSGMKFEESTFYKTGYPWPKEINEYKSEKNNIMARINDLNTKKTNALIYTWKPGMPDSEKPFGASEYFPFDQSPKLLLDHEFGHHIHQLYGVKNAKSYATPPLEKKIDQIYKKSEKDGTLIVPSKYAASDHQEWFAESYSLYVNGRDDLVTPGLIDLFKKIGVKHDN
jgi:hypothetical protein